MASLLAAIQEAAALFEGGKLSAKEFEQLKSRLLNADSGGKVFNDHIHGHIEVSPLCVSIIDTPQFQRLRDISQLGGVNFVFAGAANKRFDHSIGVSHLAKRFVTALAARQPELGVTPQDVLCVEVAGLIHDLGHGPFSHMFEKMFLEARMNVHFDHEHASIGIFDLLIAENDLMPQFRSHGLDESDIHFIKELVLGSRQSAAVADKRLKGGFQWRGRGDKTFLYDIVANQRNGIAVDKFDYFARDCHVLNIANTFDADRLIKFSRVYRVADPHPSSSAAEPGLERGELQICFHQKEAWNLNEVFHLRYNLHKRAYQHRTVGSVELMIAEALALANDHLLFPGSDGRRLRMSECCEDMQAYWRLSEYILKLIEFSATPELGPARRLIERLRRRELFPFVDERVLAKEDEHLGRSRRLPQELMRVLREMGVEAATIADEDVLCKDHTRYPFVILSPLRRQGGSHLLRQGAEEPPRQHHLLRHPEGRLLASAGGGEVGVAEPAAPAGVRGHLRADLLQAPVSAAARSPSLRAVVSAEPEDRARPYDPPQVETTASR